ncbi:MAG: FeoB-associated Cys-rich membrane protein [Planctomycetia bacterium]|nr:FeoB-associated Cys-rich membrane protein [Planctomycetia bacterium]
MNFDLQAVAAPAIVFVAVAYLARALFRKWFGSSKPGAKAGCGSCGSCPSADSAGRREPEVVNLVSLSLAPGASTSNPATISKK